MQTVTNTDLTTLFAKQHAFPPHMANTNPPQRIERLNRLIRFIDDDGEMQGLNDAMSQAQRKAEA